MKTPEVSRSKIDVVVDNSVPFTDLTTSPDDDSEPSLKRNYSGDHSMGQEVGEQSSNKMKLLKKIKLEKN